MDSSTGKLLEDFEAGRISRRQLLRALGLAAAAAVPARLIGQQVPPGAAGRGGGRGAANAAPRVPVPRPFANTGWKTVWLDKLEYECVDPEKAAGFYVALMNWRVRSNSADAAILGGGRGGAAPPAPTGPQKILLDMGEAMGSIEIRGGMTPPPPAAAGAGGNNPPLQARFTGFAWGIDQWDPTRVRAELQQRGLNPVEDNSADGEYQSFRFKDPMGFDVAVTNGSKTNRRARNANGHLANPLPFEPTYWTTLYVDHISYAVSDVRKVAGFYAALLGWNNTDMAEDATQVSPTFGDGGLVGGAIIRGGGGGGRAAGAAPAAPSGVINHISFGIKDWNTEVMRYEFIKRGLTPRNDFSGNLQSYHVRDAMGWDLQVGNKIGPSTWGE